MNVIAREPSQRGPIKRLVVDGAPVIAHYDLLMSLLKLSLDENELGIFAEPVIDDGDSVVSWGARSGNPLVSIRQVTPGERMLLIKQRDLRIDDEHHLKRLRGSPRRFGRKGGHIGIYAKCPFASLCPLP